MKIKHLYFILLFLISSLLLVKFVSAATYCTTDSGNCYVDGIDGLDSNDGKTINTAWKTIQKAADTVGPGDIVNVKGGIIYNQTPSSCVSFGGEEATVCIKTSGTADDPITYRAWEGTGTPIIDGEGAMGNGFGTKMNIAYIIIDGFEIRNYIGGSNYSLMLIAVSNHITIKNNIFHHGLIGILFDTLGGSNVAYNNIFYDINYDMIVPGLIGGMAIDNRGSLPNEFYNNVVYDCDYGFYIANNTATFKNNIVTDNIIGLKNGTGNSSAISNDYNIIWNNGTDYHTDTSSGDHDINQDPLFVDVSNNDFRLQKNSPAINSGVTVSEVIDDILKVARPQGASYDRGAYEYYDIPVTLSALSPDPIASTTPMFSGSSSTIASSTITSISYSIDSGSWVTTGVTGTSTFSIIPTTLADGAHSIRVKAIDSYSNSSDSLLYGTDFFTTDITAPVISLSGAAVQTIALGYSPTLGVTANDAVDGSVSVITSGSVNNMVLGAYTITYSATDFTGNISTSTRVVNVIYSGGGTQTGSIPTPIPTPTLISTPIPISTPTPKPSITPTLTDPQSILNSLLKQLAELQQQLANQQSKYTFTHGLQYGDIGEDVKQLQIFLKNQGIDIYPEGLVTGYFGNLTKKAVQRFQLKYNIITSDNPAYGYVGPKTRENINGM